jgi:ribonuclease J
MATLRFFGGVGSIGSSKVEVAQAGWRALFDLGPLIPGREGLLRPPVRSRPGSGLRDQIRVGEAPAIPHLYRPEALAGLDVEGGADGRSALFISHCHIDHMGLIGWVDPDMPIYASPETVAMIDALEAAGLGLDGGRPTVRPMAADEVVEVGPLRVRRYPVDHDVVGASGFGVETEDGLVAYTGDFRLHGRHPEASWAFARAVAGAEALVTEGTSLSFGGRGGIRTERDCDRAFERALLETPGLVMVTLYPRNIERVQAFLSIAEAHGRTMLWPPSMGAFLRAFGVEGVVDYGAPDTDAAVKAAPERFVLQIDLEHLTDLLDLPAGPGSVLCHANGEPLGPFQPSWDVLQDWLRFTATPFRQIGVGGHADADDLHHFVETVAPATVYPLHTDDPFRLQPPPGTLRILPREGKVYDVARRTPMPRPQDGVGHPSAPPLQARDGGRPR